MRRLACGVIAAVVFAGAVTIAAQQRIRSGISAVQLDVLVTDGNRAVRDLKAEDFEVLDYGAPQTLDSVRTELMPVSLMLVLDTSASLTGPPLEELKRGALAALDSLDPQDTVALLTFSHQVSLRQDWTHRHEDVERAIREARASGDTSLWDALYAGISHRDPVRYQDRRSLVVFFSDGADSASWLPESALLERARRTDAVIYGITVRSDDSPAMLLNRSGVELEKPALFDGTRPFGTWTTTFERITGLTGGQLFEAPSRMRLVSAFERIIGEFRTRYVLTYRPTVDVAGWHAVKVNLKNGKGQVRVRTGYMR